MIVLDASLFTAWPLNEPQDASAEVAWDQLASEPVLALAHWPNEMADALRPAVRAKRIHRNEIAPIMSASAAFGIRIAPAASAEAMGARALQALDLDLSVYDLSYVRQAQAQGLPLATPDAAMRMAARKRQLIGLPDAL